MRETIQFPTKGFSVYVDKKVFNNLMKKLSSEDIKLLEFTVKGEGLYVKYETSYSKGSVLLYERGTKS